MADIVDFLPLLTEDIETVRARIDADVNAGYAPEDEVYIDTVTGGLYWDMTQGVVQELERLWDFLSTEVPGAAFVTTAWGDYLDEHGAVIGTPRKPSTPATGEVTFTSSGSIILDPGFKVVVPQVDADTAAIEFETLAGVSITGAGTATVAVQATEAGSVGNVASGTITFILNPVSGLTSVINTSATTGGADVESDETYRNRLLIEYSSRQGAGSHDDYVRWALDYAGVGGVTVNPLWAGAGTVRVVVVDNDSNPVSTTLRDLLQTYLDPAFAQTLLVGTPNQTLSGTITVDSTTGFTSFGYFYVGENGTYQRIKYTGITPTTFTGCTGGSSTFPDDTPVIQRGHGLGIAPIGHEVTVDTPDAVTVDVDLTVALESGFTLDGDSGTTAVRDNIDAAIRLYIDALTPGQDVLLNRVEARILGVRGVYNVGTATTEVSLEAIVDDFSIADDEVAVTGTITMAVP